MKPSLELHEHLLKLRVFPDSKLIDDGEFHRFKDIESGRQFRYCVSNDGWLLREAG